jgi:hypothetical protein
MDPYEIAARLNESCQCAGADVVQLQRTIEGQLRESLPELALASSHPHLFSAVPIFLTDVQAEQMRALIAAIESVVALPAYQELVLSRAAVVARAPQPTRGVCIGYDFHMTDAGPRLIEINTNAGGALLNLELLRMQLQCCRESQELSGNRDPDVLAREFVAMFRTEWRLARAAEPLRRLAIVDTTPALQYLHPEFLLFKSCFATAGIAAEILDPAQLQLRGGKLTSEQGVVDLVYNRLTDFYFEHPQHAHLREAYLSHAAVFTPGPPAHALYADKRNLALLSSEATLASLGAGPQVIQTLMQGVPKTELVSADAAERWWADRKRWFFKPAGGFASRGAYRGDKLTRGVFQEILAGGYVAQALVSPSERQHPANASGALKVDVRNYVYAGHVQLLAARLYRGQTTNFRTPGGGFAPVFFISDARLARLQSLGEQRCANISANISRDDCGQ